MKHWLRFAALIVLYPFTAHSQIFTYSSNPHPEGFSVLSSSDESLSVAFSVHQWTLADVSAGRETLKRIELPGVFLPNDAGAPDLPGTGRLIAIPAGSTPRLQIVNLETKTYSNIDLAPAPRIPKTTENGPLEYNMDMSIYSTDAFFPAQPVRISEVTRIRGVDIVMLGVTPFRYNPVTHELMVIRSLTVNIQFDGGQGIFGDDRLRSRWWDPMLKDALLNADRLHEVDYSSRITAGRDTGFEYLIICPDDSDFTAWADTIRVFRTKQGISTGVVTTQQIGGNTVSAIEAYINNAYNSWDIPPAAVLILGDYGTTGSTVIAPIWDNYCASDNIFADVDGNELPDIVFSRMTAQNAAQLEIVVRKFIDYETDPPTDPEYYDHPVTALGWQTERWFQVCIEVVGGFFRNSLGKDPIRINEVYEGNPNTDPWSTAPNTGTIMNYFGPNGLDYIPTSPGTLGNWSGGNATQINNAINSGSFLLLHRDHGYELGWGEPAYSNSSLNGLDNEELTFVYSVNCLTGKYNYSGECFAEAFHRRPKRALGLIAASEVSYSFVNDTYVWGAFDNMWPEFMPSYGSNPEPRGLLPAFSNAAGKIFLQQSSWPYNTGNKVVTYHLFHHHGDAFMTLFSEVPQDLTVVHDGVLTGGATSYTVQADEGSLIALSADGIILGVADGTGLPVTISIPPQIPGTDIRLVVTLTNHYRYESPVTVISPNAPYVIYETHNLNDGNGNGLMDYAENSLMSLTVTNIGSVDANNALITVTSSDPYVVITDGEEQAAVIPGNGSVNLTDGFEFNVADSVPDGQMVEFTVNVAADGENWISSFVIQAHAPVLEFVDSEIDDSMGDGNGRIDPGETAGIQITMINNGSSIAYNTVTALTATGPVSVLSGPQALTELSPGQAATHTFTVVADPSTPGGTTAGFHVDLGADHNIAGEGDFSVIIGRFAALILDLDPNSHSGPQMQEAFAALDLVTDYRTFFPEDLSIYQSVFTCLGIYYSYHELTAEESLILEDYLEQGGNLYLEGRSVFYSDPQTALQPMFGISPEFTNWKPYDSVFAYSGTFTDGMAFDYDGESPFNNHILQAVDPAFPVLGSLPDSLGVMIAHEGAGYKTIGANIEFGALADGEEPSTKAALMEQMLDFFGDILTDAPETEHHDLQINVWPNPSGQRFNFSFSLPEKSPVRLEVTDLTGRVVLDVSKSSMDKGLHTITIDFPNVEGVPSSGIYLFRLNLPTGNSSGKLLLNR